jgi:hypothetical protein
VRLRAEDALHDPRHDLIRVYLGELYDHVGGVG